MVVQQLKRIGTAIAGLNASCSALRSHITAASRETGPMLEESASLTLQKRHAETKQQLLSAFTSHFLLSDGEVTALTSTAEPVTDAFFAALARVKKIHSDSQVLLGTENQRLGLEILDQSSKQLNAAFQKLFRWTQRELRTLDLENPQLSATVRRSLRVLAERPALFQGCVDFFAESREHVLSDGFYAALTGKASSGKAIELSAHDPLRYVSDMLAWAHSATVGEREALQVLFIGEGESLQQSMRAGRKNEPWLYTSTSAEKDDAEEKYADAPFDGTKALHDLVDRDLSGVVRQLRQRIEQMIQSHPDATLSYQIANLVSFYCGIFASTLGPDSAILSGLAPLTDAAMQAFRTTTRDHIANLHADVAVPSAHDLGAPEFLLEALQTLKTLMRSYDTSLANSSSATGKGEEDGFATVLTEALDPYLAGCENVAKRLGTPHGAVFATNCLSAARGALGGYAFTAEKKAELEDTIEEVVERLEDAVHHWFLRESGLKPLVDEFENWEPDLVALEFDRLEQFEVLEPERLARMARELDAFLPGAMEDARAFVGQVEDKVVVRRVCERAADRFVVEFEKLEAILRRVDEVRLEKEDKREDRDEEDEVLLVRDVFPRTSDEIKVLLS